MGSKYWRSKKGTTMVEVLAAVLILAVVVTAVLTSIGFSQRTILSESSQSDAAAQAQNLADTLIDKLHGASDTDAASVKIPDAQRVDSESFPDSAYKEQFTIVSVNNGGISGYRIRTAVYFTDSTGRKCVQMTAFAAKDGDIE